MVNSIKMLNLDWLPILDLNQLEKLVPEAVSDGINYTDENPNIADIQKLNLPHKLMSVTTLSLTVTDSL